MLNGPSCECNICTEREREREELIAERLVVSRGNDSSVPRYFFSLLREAPPFSTLRSTSTDHYPQCPWTEEKKRKKKTNLNMQGCSFKMVRQELPECTRRQSCGQDGEKEGEGGRQAGRQAGRQGGRRGGSRHLPVMWKRINLCFPVSAAKLLSCNYSYCKIMGVSLLIALLGEKKKKKGSLVARRGEIQPSLIGHEDGPMRALPLTAAQ